MERVLQGWIILAIAGNSFAAGLQNYRSWPGTPEAYFMTAPERDEWTRITTDEAAEEFVIRYFEKRGPFFREELLERIEFADRYFAIQKKRGSETLRGKLVIFLGVPVRHGRSGLDPLVETFNWQIDRPPGNLEPRRISIRVLVQSTGRETILGSRRELQALDALFAEIASASLTGE